MAQQRVAVIGPGRVGRTLGSRLLAAGWSVTYGSRHPESSRALKQALREQGDQGAQGAGVAAAVAGADCILLTIPGSALASDAACASFARALGPHVAGKVMVDATNPLDAEGSELCWERGRSSAEALQQALPGGWACVTGKACRRVLASRCPLLPAAFPQRALSTKPSTPWGWSTWRGPTARWSPASAWRSPLRGRSSGSATWRR